SPPAEEKAADVTDPDDIDALLDSVANSAAAVEQPIAEKVEDVDITDPDDIDALLESMSGNAPAVEQPIAEKAEDIDITDPDDIDALLESMSGNVPAPQQDVPATMSEPKSDMEMGEQSDIDKTMEKGSTLNAEEQRIQEEIAENEAKIAEFTAEYVTPFLTADFSDIMAKESEVKLDPETLGSNDVDELDDDLDIDALIADTISKDEASQRIQQDEREDIGDNLTGSSIDETLNNQVDDGFTESELSQLLADESLEIDAEQVDEISTESIALSPDFNDEDILAELLAETHDAEEDNLEEIEELDVIGELDDVDFDELLANIEEESAARSVEQDEIEQPLDDIGDDLIDNSLGEEGIQSDQTVEPRENYVSVDDLLTESLGEIDKSEPYEKTNIDVGLGQFSQNESGVDVDENGSMSSQLDLAKMYIEMSDEENAQVILQEVLSKGDVIQKIEAQELLDSL
ncbi:FimV/HubP family polar landmark protein, partial [Colwellia sp. 12G3]|uniref:FimV/HubP family polar landmark protein n=1 Tax=Colwellia sp. 12G3 TaxID=2058299 RepID=UPI000CCAE456